MSSISNLGGRESLEIAVTYFVKRASRKNTVKFKLSIKCIRVKPYWLNNIANIIWVVSWGNWVKNRILLGKAGKSGCCIGIIWGIMSREKEE